jgi:1-pyrroline-4-hydroxy-2-carboxylate deaminase
VQLIKQVQEECGGPSARVRPPRLELIGAERDEVIALTRQSLATCPR